MFLTWQLCVYLSKRNKVILRKVFDSLLKQQDPLSLAALESLLIQRVRKLRYLYLRKWKSQIVR